VFEVIAPFNNIWTLNYKTQQLTILFFTAVNYITWTELLKTHYDDWTQWKMWPLNFRVCMLLKHAVREVHFFALICPMHWMSELTVIFPQITNLNTTVWEFVWTWNLMKNHQFSFEKNRNWNKVWKTLPVVFFVLNHLWGSGGCYKWFSAQQLITEMTYVGSRLGNINDQNCTVLIDIWIPKANNSFSFYCWFIKTELNTLEVKITVRAVINIWITCCLDLYTCNKLVALWVKLTSKRHDPLRSH